MHLLPSSHGAGVYKHESPEDTHIDYSMVEVPKPDDVRIITLIPSPSQLSLLCIVMIN